MRHKEVIHKLGCTKAQLHRYVKSGRIRATRLNDRCYDYLEEDVMRVYHNKKKYDPALAQRMVDALGYSITELRSQARSRSLADRRRIIAVLLRDEGFSFDGIGKFLNRSHGTAYSLVNASCLEKNDKKKYDPELAQRMVNALGYSITELRSQARSRSLADRRRIIAVLLRNEGFSLDSIGKFLNRNHSTVFALVNTSYLVKDELLSAESVWMRYKA